MGKRIVHVQLGMAAAERACFRHSDRPLSRPAWLRFALRRWKKVVTNGEFGEAVVG